MDFRKRKISQVLKILTSQDTYRILEFLESPYFVKKEAQCQLIALFKLLHDYIISQGEFDIPDRKLAQIVSGNDQMDLGKLEKSLFTLTSHIYQYLGIEGLLDSHLPNIRTAKNFRKREAQNLWESILKKTAKAIKSRNNSSFDRSLELLSLEVEYFSQKSLSPIETTPKDYSAIIQSYNEFYSIYMLKTALRTIAHNKFYFPIELQSQFAPLKLILAQDNNIHKNPEKYLLHRAFHLLTGDDPNGLEELEEITAYMKKHFEVVSHETKVNIYTIVKNYAIKMYNLGDLSIGKFIFKLYKENIKNQLLFYNDKIQVGSFFNIVHCAINEKEFNWLEIFLKEYEHKILEPHLKDFTIALSKAKINFAKKEFNNVLENLDFNVVLPSLKGMARMLEIMSLFELNSNQLDHKMEAFKIYMHRVKNAKVGPRFQIGHNNFIGILRSINHPKTDFDIKRVEKIIAKINATEILAERKWLMEKCEEKAAKIR